jgi:hypothetical protein
VVQRDGSVIVRSPTGRTLWRSRRPGGATQGSLILYSPAHKRLWASGAVTGPLAIDRRTGAVRVITGAGIPAGGRVAVGRYRLTMQTDGDLVLSSGGHQRWSSHTQGHPGAYLAVARTGNVVVDSIRHVALWSSRTAGHRAAGLELRAVDGRLAVRSGGAPPVKVIVTVGRRKRK